MAETAAMVLILKDSDISTRIFSLQKFLLTRLELPIGSITAPNLQQLLNNFLVMKVFYYVVS